MVELSANVAYVSAFFCILFKLSDRFFIFCASDVDSIHWAYSNAEKSTPRDREGWTQVHIAFTTSRLDISVSESMLDNLFCRFGEIADITVKKLARTSEPPLQSGYAFVYFYDADAAMVAADTLARITVQDVTLECSLSFRSQRIVDTTIAVSSGIVPPQLAHELFPPESYGPQLKKDRHNHAHHVPQQHKAFVPALAARSNSPTYAHSMNNGSKLAHFSSHYNNQHVSEDNVFSWSQPQQQKSALFGSLSERSYSPTTFWPSNPVSNEPFTSLNAAPAHTHSLFYEEDDVLFENKYSPSQYPQYSRDSESLSDGLLLPPVHLHTPWQLNVDIPSTDYGSFSHDNSWISSSSTSSTSGEGSSPTQQSLFARAPLSAMQQATHA